MQAASGSAAASLPAMVAQHAAAYVSETIMRRKDRGIWKAISWAQLAEQVKRIGGALLAAEIARGDTVAIMSETRPEAAYADLAIQGAGAASIAIHPEESPERIEHILHSSGCRLVFVEAEEQLDKILTVGGHLPALSRIIIFDMKGLREFADPRCVSLGAFVATCPFATDWDASVNAVLPDQPAVVLFPREADSSIGHALTHRDLLRMVADTGSRVSLHPHDERLAVLRMADVTERVWGLYLALANRCTSNYLESPETAIENLQELQPTVLGADAEAWAHLHTRAMRSAKAATPTQRLLYQWALRAGRSGSLGAMVGNRLVLNSVRRELGLNKLRLAYVAGPPVSVATQDWARSLGITIQHIDEPVLSGDQPDTRHRTLMQDAHA